MEGPVFTPKRSSALPSPRSITSQQSWAEALSTPARTFGTTPNNDGNNHSDIVTAIIVAVAIATVVGIVIFSMIINRQQPPKHAVVENIYNTNTTAKIKMPVDTPRSRGNESTASMGRMISIHQRVR